MKLSLEKTERLFPDALLVWLWCCGWGLAIIFVPRPVMAAMLRAEKIRAESGALTCTGSWNWPHKY